MLDKKRRDVVLTKAKNNRDIDISFVNFQFLICLVLCLYVFLSYCESGHVSSRRLAAAAG